MRNQTLALLVLACSIAIPGTVFAQLPNVYGSPDKNCYAVTFNPGAASVDVAGIALRQECASAHMQIAIYQVREVKPELTFWKQGESFQDPQLIWDLPMGKPAVLRLVPGVYVARVTTATAPAGSNGVNYPTPYPAFSYAELNFFTVGKALPETVDFAGVGFAAPAKVRTICSAICQVQYSLHVDAQTDITYYQYGSDGTMINLGTERVGAQTGDDKAANLTAGWDRESQVFVHLVNLSDLGKARDYLIYDPSRER